jgi:hypothetical protein
MTPNDVLSLVYQFRTHPFSPSLGADGQPLKDPFALPLDPAAEPRHIGYYYDLYDWSGSSQVGPLDAARLVQSFPEPADLVNFGPLLTILAGADHSGRESLRNLLLHKIGQQLGPPLMISLTLEGGDRSQIVKQVAELFLLEYPNHFSAPTFDLLQKAFQTMTRTKSVGHQYSYYANLFQYWRNQIQATCNRPLVLNIKGKPDYNTWQVLYNSTRELFPYFFVLTGDVAAAKTCRETMQGGNVAVIVAPLLSEMEALKYVRLRVSKERPNEMPSSIEPFTPAAISALYQRGPTASQDVRWQIAFINRTMRRALDDHLQMLLGILQARGALDRALLSPQEIEIDAGAVRRAREALNMGQ